MWFFKKNRIYDPNAKPFRPTIVGITLVFVLILLFLQTVGLLFNLQGIKLGPMFMVILISSISLAAFAIAKKQIQGIAIGKQDLIAIIVLVVVTIIALFYLRDLVPEIFQQSVMNLKDIAQTFLPLP